MTVRTADARGMSSNIDTFIQAAERGDVSALREMLAQSPTLSVMGEDELRALSVANIGAAVSQLPAFRASNNPTTNGFGSFTSVRKS